MNTPLDLVLLSSAVDRLSYLVWMQTEDARKKRNRPESIYEHLFSRQQDDGNRGFNSVEEFEAVRAKLFGGEN